MQLAKCSMQNAACKMDIKIKNTRCARQLQSPITCGPSKAAGCTCRLQLQLMLLLLVIDLDTAGRLWVYDAEYRRV